MTASTRLKVAGLVWVLAVMLLSMPAQTADISPRAELIGTMSADRAAHQATLLRTGEVLITGGCGGVRCGSTHASVDLYDPVAGSIRPIGRMRAPRSSHVAVALPDGRVLVAGGWSGESALASAEMYDPSTMQFTPLGDMMEPRIDAVATLLTDGRVLVTGGEAAMNAALSSAEVFDPETSTFSAIGPMRARRTQHIAVALADGTVLIAGGRSARGELLRSAEIFDVSTGDFRLAGNMTTARHKLAGALVLDGKVLVVGGSDASDYRGRYSSTELYDPETGTFSPGPEMNYVRYKIRDAVLTLPSGQVVVAGGAARPELLVQTGHLFVAAQGDLSGPQMFATATLLRSGPVLILGGYDENIRSSSSAWLLHVPRSD